MIDSVVPLIFCPVQFLDSLVAPNIQLLDVIKKIYTLGHSSAQMAVALITHSVPVHLMVVPSADGS